MIKNRILVRPARLSRCMVFTAQQKIIQFNDIKKNYLTDDDINSLFVGLLSLVKGKAQKSAELCYKRQVEYYKDLLVMATAKTVKLQNKIKKLTSKQ